MQAALDPKVDAQIKGIVLTSPAVGVNPSHPIFNVSSFFFCLDIRTLRISDAFLYLTVFLLS